MQLAAAIAFFLQRLQTEKQLSPHTLDAYRRDLAKLQQLAEAEGLARIDELKEMLLRGWLAQLHRGGLGARSLQRWLSAVRGLCNCGLREGWLKANPAEGCARPREKNDCRSCWMWTRRRTLSKAPATSVCTCATGPYWNSSTAAACACPS
ncbi:site-specific integrase [Microbulbifer taiwanensis]|uniref:site-specific integrase n=1 Tax=Microbulbifer taiwanensis TaxID=986746 RepID=UPI003618BCF8